MRRRLKLPLPELLSVPDFRPLLFIGFIAFVVRWIEMLAFALFAYQMTGSAFVVAMLTMLRVLPMGLFGAFIGAAADKFALRSALILIIVAMTATTLVLAVLASLDALEVWHLAVASFINGTGWAADNPVRRMMIGNTVGPQRMGSAIALDVGSSNASRVIGPLLSGALMASFGIASVFWCGLLLYAAALAVAWRIGAHGVPSHAPSVSFLAGLRQGIGWLRGERNVTGVFVVTVIFNIFGWPYTSMIPVISTDYFQLDPQGVGLLASSEGVGGLLGALLFASLVRSEWYGRIYLGATAAYFAMMIGFATAPDARAAAVFLLLSGLTGVGFSVMQTTLVYRDSPVEMRGRLLGVLSVCIGTGPLGFMYLGFLADALTPRGATVAMALQGIAALLLTRRYWAPIARQ